MKRVEHGLRLALLPLLLGLATSAVPAQDNKQDDTAARLQQLNESIDKTQHQLEETQHQLDDLKVQMHALQQQLAAERPAEAAAPAEKPLDDVREQQAMQQSELATLQESKVESDSKYPVRLSGMVLLNAFVNAQDVDAVTSPALSLPGAGSTGFTLRQSILGLDARGPHLVGARGYADLRLDFAGSPGQSSTAGIYSGWYGSGMSFLRLRTAHAGLAWRSAEAYFALDRPIFSPDSPASLAAVAEPALAWSGNLWAWNPQIGVNAFTPLGRNGRLLFQGAVMDVADAPLTPAFYLTTNSVGPSSGQYSRWPGAEARVAWQRSAEEGSDHVGVGGFFAPHRYPGRYTMDAWAATLDAHFHLPARLQFTSSFYRGLGLGGLGGGAYKDYLYRSYGGYSDFTGLSDVGGWAELKEKVSPRLEFNTAFGTDQLFAGEVRPYARALTTMYQSLARNRTFTANTIFSPSAYLLFSLEYRHIASSPVAGTTANSNVVALSAGYKF